MSLGKVHSSEPTSIGPSAWAMSRLPPDFLGDVSQYNKIMEEFHVVPVITNGWVLDESDGTADITADVTVEGGKVNIQVDTTDNIESWIQYICPLVKASLGRKFLCEWGISMLLVGNNEGAIVCGLGEVSAAGDDVWQVDDTGALADIDFIGFQTLHANGDSLNAIQRLDGGSLVTVESAVGVPVISTLLRLGIYGDGARAYFAVNGVQTAKSTAYGSTDFPLDILMAPVLATKLGSAVTQNVKGIYCLCVGDKN